MLVCRYAIYDSDFSGIYQLQKDYFDKWHDGSIHFRPEPLAWVVCVDDKEDKPPFKGGQVYACYSETTPRFYPDVRCIMDFYGNNKRALYKLHQYLEKSANLDSKILTFVINPKNEAWKKMVEQFGYDLVGLQYSKDCVSLDIDSKT